MDTPGNVASRLPFSPHLRSKALQEQNGIRRRRTGLAALALSG